MKNNWKITWKAGGPWDLGLRGQVGAYVVCNDRYRGGRGL